jgi:hypothetical protein
VKVWNPHDGVCEEFSFPKTLVDFYEAIEHDIAQDGYIHGCNK